MLGPQFWKGFFFGAIWGLVVGGFLTLFWLMLKHGRRLPGASMTEEIHKLRDMAPEDAQREFRGLIVHLGIVTEQQAAAVTFTRVNPADHPEIPRCTCESCKNDTSFMAFGIDQEKLSPIQFKLIVATYNKYAGPFIPASADPSEWTRKKPQ
jgi:hypothetical protein